jgi:hypothetical protein
MRRISLLTIAVGLLVSFWPVAPAHAQNLQSYVSPLGNDGNDCTLQHPCADFFTALTKTDVGGEVDCLGAPGGNSSFTIKKSVMIDCTGVGGATMVNVTIGITINVAPGDPLQTVRLRGLSINGTGAQGSRGISIIAAGTVILEDMEIIGQTQQGIADVRTHGGLLLVKNTVIAKSAGAGIAIAATGGPFGATLENVRSLGNGFGLAVGSGNNVMVTRSVLSGSTVAGLEMDAGAQVTLDSSIVNFNPTGLQSSGFLTLMGSTISYNNTAIIGASNSFGDNRIYGNSSPGTAPTVGATSTDHSKQ